MDETPFLTHLLITLAMGICFFLLGFHRGREVSKHREEVWKETDEMNTRFTFEWIKKNLDPKEARKYADDLLSFWRKEKQRCLDNSVREKCR